MKLRLQKLFYRLGLYRPGAVFEAKVIRANGNVESLGIIAFGKTNLKAKV